MGHRSRYFSIASSPFLRSTCVSWRPRNDFVVHQGAVAHSLKNTVIRTCFTEVLSKLVMPIYKWIVLCTESCTYRREFSKGISKVFPVLFNKVQRLIITLSMLFILTVDIAQSYYRYWVMCPNTVFLYVVYIFNLRISCIQVE